MDQEAFNIGDAKIGLVYLPIFTRIEQLLEDHPFCRRPPNQQPGVAMLALKFLAHLYFMGRLGQVPYVNPNTVGKVLGVARQRISEAVAFLATLGIRQDADGRWQLPQVTSDAVFNLPDVANALEDRQKADVPYDSISAALDMRLFLPIASRAIYALRPEEFYVLAYLARRAESRWSNFPRYIKQPYGERYIDRRINIALPLRHGRVSPDKLSDHAVLLGFGLPRTRRALCRLAVLGFIAVRRKNGSSPYSVTVQGNRGAGEMLHAYSRMRSWEGCKTDDFAPLRDVSDLLARQHDEEEPVEQLIDTTD